MPAGHVPSTPPVPDGAVPLPTWPLVLLFAPFLANDLGNIFVRSPGWWIAQDYAWRILVLGLAAWLATRGRVRIAGLRWPAEAWATAAGWTLFTTAAGLWLIDGPGRQLLQLWPETRTGFIPPIVSPGLRGFDLSVGLALVAVSEEVVFRGVLLPRLSRWLRSEVAGLVASAVLFGLAHWSTGAGAVLQTGLAGLLLGLCTQRTRSLLPAVLAHYVINLAAFS